MTTLNIYTTIGFLNKPHSNHFELKYKTTKALTKLKTLIKTNEDLKATSNIIIGTLAFGICSSCQINQAFLGVLALQVAYFAKKLKGNF